MRHANDWCAHGFIPLFSDPPCGIKINPFELLLFSSKLVLIFQRHINMCQNCFNRFLKATGLITFVILLGFLVFWTVKSFLPVAEGRGETDHGVKFNENLKKPLIFNPVWFQHIDKDELNLYLSNLQSLNSTLNSAIETKMPTTAGLTTTPSTTTMTPMPGEPKYPFITATPRPPMTAEERKKFKFVFPKGHFMNDLLYPSILK